MTVIGSPDEGDTSDKITLAKSVFTEVLDSTKHQDDKTGRFLTAIAFLTTGSLTLLANVHALSTPFNLDGRMAPLALYSLFIFILSALAAVILFLMGMGSPHSRLPEGSRDAERLSTIYFFHISNTPKEEWMRLLKSDSSILSTRIAEDYWRDSWKLSKRVSIKNERSGEAATMFIFGVLFLALSTALIVDVFLHERSSDHEVSYRLRAVIASIVAGHAVLQLYGDLRRQQSDLESLSSGELESRLAEIKLTYWMMVAVTIIVGFLLIPSPGEACAGIAVVGVLLGIFLWNCRPKMSRWICGIAHVTKSLFSLLLIFALAIVWSMLKGDLTARITLTLLIPTFLSSMNLYGQTAERRRRIKSLLKTADS